MEFSQRYHMIREIGKGGMGEVWLVYDKQIGATFAMKRLLPDLTRKKDWERFKREINHLRRLNHPNIIKIVESSLDIESPYYTMEYCSKGSVDSLKYESKGNEKITINIFNQVMDALIFLHELKSPIIHRDIKPNNILIGEDGMIKLADFGLSIAPDDITVTTSQWVSYGFSAPEQSLDMHAVDQRADIYSAAAVAFHMFTGKYADGRNFSDLRGVKSKTLAHLPRLLAHNVDDRPRTAREVIEGIEQVFFESNSTGEYLSYSGIVQCEECGSWAIEVTNIDPHSETNQITCLGCKKVFPEIYREKN